MRASFNTNFWIALSVDWKKNEKCIPRIKQSHWLYPLQTKFCLKFRFRQNKTKKTKQAILLRDLHINTIFFNINFSLIRGHSLSTRFQSQLLVRCGLDGSCHCTRLQDEEEITWKIVTTSSHPDGKPQQLQLKLRPRLRLQYHLLYIISASQGGAHPTPLEATFQTKMEAQVAIKVVGERGKWGRRPPETCTICLDYQLQSFPK